MTLEEFYKAYPQQTKKIKGKDFVYRYHRNENAASTLVLLTGGIGLSDLFFMHFDRFAKDFSVITFDYLICYPTMAEFADAVAELIKSLDLKVWLVGQSLGGAAAQIITKRHPEIVEGLILSNTAAVQNSGGSKEYFEGMKKRQSKSRRMIKIVPFGIAKKFMLKAIRKKTEKLPPEQKDRFEALADVMLNMLTKEYELHMIDMLIDCGNHLNISKKDFEFLSDRVMLVINEDDETFSQETKQQFINVMTKPYVLKEKSGGHLGALMDIENYAASVIEYITSRE
ncbi:MAG: alpha/beta hydrolase [Oscillospiraceae bacterium]|nr:alpha/beta hydrolase [Oscillospiraceae bacterium]